MKTSKTDPFPWEPAMVFALGRLGWSPDQFWQSTPKELAMAMKAHTQQVPQPISRSSLETLMNSYPDEHVFEENKLG